MEASIWSQTWMHHLVFTGIVALMGMLVIPLLLKVARLAARRFGFSPLSIGPLETTIYWSICLFLAAVVLDRFGVHLFPALSAVIALIGVGFIAMWSVMSNLLCTLLLILFKPFSDDDILEFPGENVRGRVKAQNTLYTVLDDEAGGEFQIPNNFFFQKTLHRIPSGSGRAPRNQDSISEDPRKV